MADRSPSRELPNSQTSSHESRRSQGRAGSLRASQARLVHPTLLGGASIQLFHVGGETVQKQ